MMSRWKLRRGSFIKPVRVEGSTDLKRWQTLEQGQPIFRQPDGVNRLHVSFPAGTWPWLRLTVDDQRTPPIPFTGAHIRVAVTEPAPTVWLPVTIAERNENPGETRLALNLGAANLSLTAVQIETAEPLFTRHVTFAVPQVIGRHHSRANHRPGCDLSRRHRRPARGGKPFGALGKSGPFAGIALVHSQSGQPAIAHHRGARGTAAGLSRVSRATGRRLSSADRQRPMRRAALRPGRAGHEPQIRGGRADQAPAAGEQPGLSPTGSAARHRGNRHGARRVGVEIPPAGENHPRRRTTIGT